MMRSHEEIQAEREAGEKFIKEHPRSMFGDDNVRRFRIFEKIIEKSERGETANQLYDFVDDAYEDSSEHSHACAVIEWLFEEGEPPYSGE